MDAPTRKLLVFFGGLAVFALALILGATAILRRLAQEAPGGGAPLPGLSAPAPQPPRGDGSATYEIQRGTVDRRPIIYRDTGFTPAEITIRANDDIGCLITIVNKSESPLRVGVNPHNPSGDPGANYGLIAPGETAVLDPRYPGLEAVSLHNHFNPAPGFRVVYAESCK